jgi:glycosyltransferase involved in cell wall biosynthesis
MAAEPSIDLSVLIASKDRREMLRRCLETLVAQTADPRSFEVVVVDDGSSDGTAAMVEALTTPFALRVLRLEESRWIAGARNFGVEACVGTVCLHIDDDIICSPQLVAEHLAAHRAEPRTLGIGKLILEQPVGDDWYAESVADGIAEHYEELATRAATWSDVYGANFSVPRAAYLELGGFASGLPTAIDLELGLRLSEHGCLLRYLPEARGIHDDPKPFGRMLQEAGLEGEAHVRLVERHPSTEKQMLNWRGGSGSKELLVRRALIALRFPPQPLIWAGHVIPSPGGKMVWGHFVRRYAFWRSVRRQVSRPRWKALTA